MADTVPPRKAYGPKDGRPRPCRTSRLAVYSWLPKLIILTHRERSAHCFCTQGYLYDNRSCSWLVVSLMKCEARWVKLQVANGNRRGA